MQLPCGFSFAAKCNSDLAKIGTRKTNSPHNNSQALKLTQGPKKQAQMLVRALRQAPTVRRDRCILTAVCLHRGRLNNLRFIVNTVALVVSRLFRDVPVTKQRHTEADAVLVESARIVNYFSASECRRARDRFCAKFLRCGWLWRRYRLRICVGSILHNLSSAAWERYPRSD